MLLKLVKMNLVRNQNFLYNKVRRPTTTIIIFNKYKVSTFSEIRKKFTKTQTDFSEIMII